MRDSVDDVQPIRPLDVEADVVVLADEGRVEGRDQLPDVTKDEEPDDAERDSGESKLLLFFSRGRAARHRRLRKPRLMVIATTDESRKNGRSATSVGSVRIGLPLQRMFFGKVLLLLRLIRRKKLLDEISEKDVGGLVRDREVVGDGVATRLKRRWMMLRRRL